MRTRRSRIAPLARSAFAGFCFPPDVIVLVVRWYLRIGLSYRDVEELPAERGIEVDHVTIYRWVLRFTRLLAEARGVPETGSVGHAARSCSWIRPPRTSRRWICLAAGGPATPWRCDHWGADRSRLRWGR
jgi:hypothetical protein